MVETTSDPYSLFIYAAMKSPLTTDRYLTRLRKLFDSIPIPGSGMEERCKVFVDFGSQRSLIAAGKAIYLHSESHT